MEQEAIEHRGHRIELADSDAGPVLLIDDEVVDWGRFSEDGRVFLRRYAYDPADSPLEVARRYVDYLDRVAEIRAQAGA